MKNRYFISIVLFMAVALIGKYSYDYYLTSKLLDLKIFQGEQLVSDALNLKMYKFIYKSIHDGKTDKLENILSEFIEKEEHRIKSEKGNYPINENQLNIIDGALNET